MLLAAAGGRGRWLAGAVVTGVFTGIAPEPSSGPSAGSSAGSMLTGTCGPEIPPGSVNAGCGGESAAGWVGGSAIGRMMTINVKKTSAQTLMTVGRREETLAFPSFLRIHSHPGHDYSHSRYDYSHSGHDSIPGD